MNIIYDFYIRIGFSPALTTALINSMTGTLIIIIVIALHRGYLFFQEMKKMTLEDISEEKFKIETDIVMKKYLGKNTYLFVLIINLFLFIADYIIITIL